MPNRRTLNFEDYWYGVYSVETNGIARRLLVWIYKIRLLADVEYEYVLQTLHGNDLKIIKP